MPDELRVFIADDHPIFRHGLKRMIEAEEGISVVGEAKDGDSAVDLLPDCKADLAILDVDMPGKDGFEVVRHLRRFNISVDVVFLTMHKDERFLNAALDLGVRGYVLKDSAMSEIVDCVRQVASGQDYVSPQLSSYLIRRIRGHHEPQSQRDNWLESLTPTEREVMRQIARYKTSKEIASELGTSPRTVEHHRANICQKLGLHGSHALLKLAIEKADQL